MLNLIITANLIDWVWGNQVVILTSFAELQFQCYECCYNIAYHKIFNKITWRLHYSFCIISIDYCPNNYHLLNNMLSPVSGVAGSRIRDFHCVYYGKEYMECTWESGPVQPPNSQHYLYYWWALPCKMLLTNSKCFHRGIKGLSCLCLRGVNLLECTE